MAAIVTFLAFSAFHMPDTVMTRPHPAFWRIILGCGMLYTMFMLYLLFLPLDLARKELTVFYDDLGVDLEEKNYAEDCRLFTPDDPDSNFKNLSDAVFDIHFIAHLFGWWFKVLIVRDLKILWLSSIVFELLELTFKHWLPNFSECWWDHVSLFISHTFSFCLIFSDVRCSEFSLAGQLLKFSQSKS